MNRWLIANIRVSEKSKLVYLLRADQSLRAEHVIRSYANVWWHCVLIDFLKRAYRTLSHSLGVIRRTIDKDLIRWRAITCSMNFHHPSVLTLLSAQVVGGEKLWRQTLLLSHNVWLSSSSPRAIRNPDRRWHDDNDSKWRFFLRSHVNVMRPMCPTAFALGIVMMSSRTEDNELMFGWGMEDQHHTKLDWIDSEEVNKWYKKDDNCKMERAHQNGLIEMNEISKQKKKQKISEWKSFRRASFENKSDSLKSVFILESLDVKMKEMEECIRICSPDKKKTKKYQRRNKVRYIPA